MPYILKRWTELDHLWGLWSSHLLEDRVIRLCCHGSQFVFYFTLFLGRFSELGFAEKVAAEEFAQRSVNSLKFLQSKENTALDSSMKLSSCDRTWLETAKDNVSSYLISKKWSCNIHYWR